MTLPVTPTVTLPEIQTLQNGAIDIEYYRQQAERARAAAIRSGVRALGRWLKTQLRIQPRAIAPYQLSH